MRLKAMFVLVLVVFMSAVASAISQRIFDTRIDYPVGWYPRLLVLADMDNDGAIDVINAGDNEVSILLNRGNGLFDEAQIDSLTTGQTYMEAADFDGPDRDADGISDAMEEQRVASAPNPALGRQKLWG